MATTDAELARILEATRVIACVGASGRTERPSHDVSAYLTAQGYRVIGVNPGHAGETLFGETVVARLSDIPRDCPVDMVDIFRRSDAVPPIVAEALDVLPHLRCIWMQIGVRHEGTAALARARGIAVIQNRCPKIDHARLIARLPPRPFA